METLWAELARAKEQARTSDPAALKAAEELKAEQAAHRQSEDKITKMAVELQNATSRYELLERESQAKVADLRRPWKQPRKLTLKSERCGRSFAKPEISRLGSPFYCGRSSAIQSMPLLINCGVLQTHTWI